ncbi:MAG TPA: response regulator [Methylibium sp.]|nr:response regulator [Methylibium sp.]
MSASPSPSSPAATPLRVAIQGFGAFERQALEGFLRLSARHGPSFEPVATLAEADCCVVDADHPLAVQAVQAGGRVAVSVFVGAQAPADAPVRLSRPLDALQVARALHALAQARAAARPAAPASDPAEPVPHYPLDVLVVDDCDIARRYLQVQLQRYGCRVAVAADGREALERAQRQTLRLVFVDADLPGLDGPALCRHLKAAGTPAPAVAIVSGRASPAERARARLAGCDAFLVKPLTASVLLAVLRTQSA